MARTMAARLAGAITHVATQRPVAALTFDDGPETPSTGVILDILGRHGAKATFFVTGEAARRHPDIILRTLAEGHEIGNHTYSHADLTALPLSQVRTEMGRTDAVLAPCRTRLVRPPFGRLDVSTNLLLAAMRRRVILWSVTSSDWSEASPSRIKANLERRIHPGAIVLLHDGLSRAPGRTGPGISREVTCEALSSFLAEWSDRYTFMTVSNLLACGAIHRSWITSGPNKKGKP